MPKGPMIGFLLAALAGLACLLFLLFMPGGRFNYMTARPEVSRRDIAANRAFRDIWMNALLDGKKIGYSHLSLKKTGNGFMLAETLSVRFNVLGVTRPVKMRTRARLLSDMRLSSFDFTLHSGLFSFFAKGRMTGPDTLSVTMRSGGDVTLKGKTRKITVKKPPVLGSTLLFSVAAAKDLKPGDRYSFFIFDPATMGKAPVTVEVLGKERISNMGIEVNSIKLAIDFKGTRETAWIDDNGSIIREAGIMGLSFERTSRRDALITKTQGPGPDILDKASIPSNIEIADPVSARRLVAEVSGVDTKKLSLSGGRQSFDGNRLTVVLEDTDGLNAITSLLDEKVYAKYLLPEPFVESDDPGIKSLARRLTCGRNSLYEKARSLWSWVNQNIEKRPVISLPDALETLENRVGDCNEHAALLCALARSAGIPARIETGLVYMRGRFYYHAWNSLYVGRWITADSALGQFPADVTHLRLITGPPENQLDYAGIIGNMKIRVVSIK